MYKIVFFYLVFLSSIAGGAVGLVLNPSLYMPADEFITLRAVDGKKYDSITLGLEPYRGVMLAANLLGNVNLYSIEDSYFPKIQYDPERITAKDPLLTTADSCLMGNAVDAVKLSAKLVLIEKATSSKEGVFYFDRKPYCNGMKLDVIRGLYPTEEWGAWSEGAETEFLIAINKAYPQGGRLAITVRPVINPKLVGDSRIVKVTVDGKYQKRFNFSSAAQDTIVIDFDRKEPGSQLTIVLSYANPVRLSDINSSDPRSSSLGFLSAELLDDLGGLIRIASVAGAYDRESDGLNWWRWVEHKVIFELQPLFVSKVATQTRLRFEYGTRGGQTLTVRIRARDEIIWQFKLDGQRDSFATFDKLIDIPPIKIAEVSIESDGQASPLGEQDTRVASWVIRNMTIAPASP